MRSQYSETALIIGPSARQNRVAEQLATRYREISERAWTSN
jgi:hypothetical protein